MSGLLRTTCLLAAIAFSQRVADAQGSVVDGALARWRAEHGGSWDVALDGGTGFAEFVYGGSAAAPFEPSNEADWFRLARHALAATEALHGIEGATLIEDRVLYLPLGMAGGADKMTVRFRQFVAGVPVDGGSANVLFRPDGALLSVQTRALPRVAGLEVPATLDAAAAIELARAAFTSDTGIAGDVAAEPELVVAQIEQPERRAPRLAWKIDVQRIA